MPAIPVIPYDQKGRIGLKEILKSKDQVGNTLFNILLQGAGQVPADSVNFLKNKFAPAVSDFMFGPTPDVPRDMQGTEMVDDPQNPGKFIHPGALQIQQRDSMF